MFCCDVVTIHLYLSRVNKKDTDVSFYFAVDWLGKRLVLALVVVGRLENLRGVFMGKGAAAIIAFGVMIIFLVAFPNGEAKGTVIALMGVAFAILVYIAPTLVANDRKHPDLSSIAAVNILLGWSLIGWVVALAWALKSTGSAQVVINNNVHESKSTTSDKYRACPFCAEQILAAAIKCRYCGSEIAKEEAALSPDSMVENTPCPECKELIRSGACACRHCGASIAKA